MIDLNDKLSRMNNLYWIVNKSGQSIPFKMNSIQQEVMGNLHKRNLLLKARQVGMSTFSVLYLLDETLFNPHLSAGIVSYSMEHSQHIFKKMIGHALDNFPSYLKPYIGIKNRSAREIAFDNGSFLRVDTSLRGGSYQLVLVSEFGKTCARSPMKAEEVVTGTLQTVSPEGTIIIESTGEGNEGYFADMVNQAHQRGNENLNALEYKLFFFPWYSDPEYTRKDKVSYDIELVDYFKKIENDNKVKLTQGQKNWYALQSKVLGDKIRQEFPSTIAEAFLTSSDAYYFAKAIAKCYEEDRCLQTNPMDFLYPVYVAMDIGVNDTTVIVFFQVVHGEVRVIDFYDDNDKDVPFYCNFLLNEKKYSYHTIYLPHDSTKRDPLDVTTSYEKDFRRLFAHTNTRIEVLKKSDKQMLISHARMILDRAVFYEKRTKKFLDMVFKYRKKWHEPTGQYLPEPYHNEASNYADAWQYTAQAVTLIERGGNKNSLEKHKEATEARLRRII